MQRDTMFRIASMTKPVTVAAAMTLVEEGRLSLTDPVAKWLPELSDMRVLSDLRGSLDDTVPAAAADHGRRPDDPPQRVCVRVLGVGSARSRLRQAVAPPGPGRLAGGSRRASAGPSARRAADLQRLHRRARHRAVAHRGQAAERRVDRAHLRAARHARHRLQRRPDRTAAAPPRCTSSTTTTRCATTRWARRRSTIRRSAAAGLGCGRRPTTICASSGCCSGAERSTECGCCPRSRWRRCAPTG